MTFPAELLPSKHGFDPDPLTQDTTCLVCGEPRNFGALHAEEFGPDQPDVELQVCRRCYHVAHSQPCDAAVVVFPRPIACGCGGAA